jgi:rubrerythrin
MARFNCSFCSYSLEYEEKPKKCPYCGKSNALEKEEKAEELI